MIAKVPAGDDLDLGKALGIVNRHEEAGSANQDRGKGPIPLARRVVELRGIEPLTSAVRLQRSPI